MRQTLAGGNRPDFRKQVAEGLQKKGQFRECDARNARGVAPGVQIIAGGGSRGEGETDLGAGAGNALEDADDSRGEVGIPAGEESSEEEEDVERVV